MVYSLCNTLACPGTLVIGVPVSSVAGIGILAKNKILIHGGDTITVFAKTNAGLVNKTGTLTKGNMEVIKFDFFGEDFNTDFKICVGMKATSNHPLKKAILNYHYDIENTILNVIALKGIGLLYENGADIYYLAGLRLLDLNVID